MSLQMKMFGGYLKFKIIFLDLGFQVYLLPKVW